MLSTFCWLNFLRQVKWSCFIESRPFNFNEVLNEGFMNSWFVLNVRPGFSRPAYNDRFVSQEQGRGYFACLLSVDGSAYSIIFWICLSNLVLWKNQKETCLVTNLNKRRRQWILQIFIQNEIRFGIYFDCVDRKYLHAFNFILGDFRDFEGIICSLHDKYRCLMYG